MFKRSKRREANCGLHCGDEGLYLGPASLIDRAETGVYRVRPSDEIRALLAATYEASPDIERCLAGLARIAGHLSAGDLPLAMIAAVQLNLRDVAEDRIERLVRTDALLKSNFNPDQPRDSHGRWTDEGNDSYSTEDGSRDIVPTGEGSRSSGTDQVPASASDSSPVASRVWENYPNADFRNRLAAAEGSAKHDNFGYGEVNNPSDPKRIALGRYQLTPGALRAAGMTDRAGNWTGKYGVHSQSEFLADPDAQEKALSDYLADNQRQLRANGAFAHIGETIDGLKARFPVTRAGILAAAHREGARATRDYLNRVAGNRYTSRGLGLNQRELAIETRLRTFSGASYE